MKKRETNFSHKHLKENSGRGKKKKNSEKDSTVINNNNNNNICLELLRSRWVKLQTPSTKKEKEAFLKCINN